jgi:hypothetical protein
MAVMRRRIRALYDESTITVYQAYSADIADAALRIGTFAPPFKMDRMTWIKPSFLWMMYRSGWATKPGQERVLAVSITRSGFEWALENSSLSAFDPARHASHEQWRKEFTTSQVRIQWDPDKDLDLHSLPDRAIQIGIGRTVIQRYVNEWIVSIADQTELAQMIKALTSKGQRSQARELLPLEREYPSSPWVNRRIGIVG